MGCGRCICKLTVLCICVRVCCQSSYLKRIAKHFLSIYSQSPPVPYWKIMKSLPFYAILFAHMGQNYGYETLMTELPTYMKQVLRFSIKEVSCFGFDNWRGSDGSSVMQSTNCLLCVFIFTLIQNGTLSALPYLAMWLFSMFISVVADWMFCSGRFSHTGTRKVINSLGMFANFQYFNFFVLVHFWCIKKKSNLTFFLHWFFFQLSGQYSPAICLIIASYTGCNRVLTVFLLTLGVGLNGSIYSGFKINHLGNLK